MKFWTRMLVRVFTLAACLLCMLIALQSRASTGVVRSFEYSFEPNPMPDSPGPARLELIFTKKPHFTCDTIKVVITEIKNLGYDGDSSFTVLNEDSETHKLVFDVEIPANDTSGMYLEVICGRMSNPAACYFVTTGDTLEHYRGTLRGWYKIPAPPRTGPRQGRVIPGEFPHYDSAYGYGDTMTAWHEMMRHGKILDPQPREVKSSAAITLDSLHKLELSPLVDKARESYRIGDTIYRRYQGDYEFEVKRPAKNRMEWVSGQAERSKEFPQEFVLDLRDPEKREQALTIVDSLMAYRDSTGHFLVVLTEQQYWNLAAKNIRAKSRKNFERESKSRSRRSGEETDDGENEGEVKRVAFTILFGRVQTGHIGNRMIRELG